MKKLSRNLVSCSRSRIVIQNLVCSVLLSSLEDLITGYCKGKNINASSSHLCLEFGKKPDDKDDELMKMRNCCSSNFDLLVGSQPWFTVKRNVLPAVCPTELEEISRIFDFGNTFSQRSSFGKQSRR